MSRPKRISSSVVFTYKGIEMHVNVDHVKKDVKLVTSTWVWTFDIYDRYLQCSAALGARLFDQVEQQYREAEAKKVHDRRKSDGV